MPTSQINKEKDIPTFKLFSGQAEWPSTEILHHEYIQHRVEGHEGSIRTHRHLDLFHVIYLSRGAARVALDGEHMVVHAPLIATVPPLIVHGFETLDQNVQGHLLTVPGSSMQHVLSHADNDLDIIETPCVVKGKPSEKFTDLDQLMRQIAIEYREQKKSRFMAIQSLTRLLFVSIIRRHHADQKKLSVMTDRDALRIRKFKKLIENSFTEGTSIKKYASQLGISSAQLNNICRSKVGKSALQIVHERTTLEAKRQLIYTSLTISQIAYSLGFNDPAYFTRFFNKQTGASPKKFRQAQSLYGQEQSFSGTLR